MITSYLYEDEYGRYHSSPDSVKSGDAVTHVLVWPAVQTYLYNKITRIKSYDPVIIYPSELLDWEEKDIVN